MGALGGCPIASSVCDRDIYMARLEGKNPPIHSYGPTIDPFVIY
jgi:hypothetical protein